MTPTTLTPGTRLGPFVVGDILGLGGMGAVYRAHDTKLGRDVAIKVLLPAVANDPERLARFQREAKTLASLNHPHIGGIYGLEDADGVTALVLELVEGPTLADRIAKGAIPLDEALPIAKQIAEALEAAHEQGIIHRDLKPANIKVRPDGTVKVLDFGLAKAMETGAGTSPNVTQSPTITSPAQMTGVGVILGTAAYMAPEQARGKMVDKRADIWAFGAVLFEMLTGTRAFEGEDIADTLGNVMKLEPNWDRCPASIPARVDRVMRACLQKNPKQRLDSAQAVWLALEGAFETAAPLPVAAMLTPRPLWRRVPPVAGAAMVTAVVAVVAAWSLWPTAAPVPVNRFSHVLSEGQVFRSTGRNVIAVSPDGRRFAYNTPRGIYLRSLDELEARPIPGTEAPLHNLFFSPDGQSIGYWQDGWLKRIAIAGGSPVVIAPAANPWGASWSRDGIIVFAEDEGILRVPVTGGTPALVIPAQAGEWLASPQLLPDGETVLFAVGRVTPQVAAQTIATGERKVLVEGGFGARYLATGHLVYIVGNVLMGVAFDVRRLAVTGNVVPLVQGVMRTSNLMRTSNQGAPSANYGVASDGTLVWVHTANSANQITRQLALSDRAGKLTPLSLQPGAYDTLRMSPDGTRVAVDVADPKDAYIAIYDLDGRTALRRLTFGGNSRYPVWSRNGQRVTFQSDREGDLAIFWQRADGTGPAERLTKPEKDTAHVPASWSPKDETLLFTVIPLQVPEGSGALWTYARASGTSAAFGGVNGAAQSPMFSPDGRWVAYAVLGGAGGVPGASFIQPFPATGARYQLPPDVTNPTANAGSHPFWSPDGTMLFFTRGGPEFLMTSVTTQPTVAFGNPAIVPKQFPAGSAISPRRHDITPDGRFIGLIDPGLAAATGPAPRPEIHIVLNWTEELKRLVPTK